MENMLLNRIDARRKELLLSEHAVAKRAGIDVGTIRDLRRGKRRSLRLETLAKLAPALETSIAWLSGETEHHPGASEPAPQSDDANVEPMPDLGDQVRIADVAAPIPATMVEDIPVLGTAQGSIIRQVEGFQFEGGQINTVRRPPGLAAARGIYAIYVEGDSMSPAHPAGELRFVNPHRPPQIGDTVVVVTKHYDGDPGQAYIKVLKKRTPTHLLLEQYNPQAVLDVPTKYVVSMHRVLTMNDLFGLA